MKKYNSIENSYREAFIEKASAIHNLKIPFVLLEKIDGANFGIQVTKDGCVCQSRSQTLGISANFYNFLTVLEKHRILHKLEVLFSEHSYGEGFTIFGEIFGGSYAGVSRGTRVQNRVDYCPENMIMFFDIFDHNTETYVPYKEFQKICETWELPYIQPIMTCSLEQALEFDVDPYKTEIPSVLRGYGIEYPEKDFEDCIEGIVIRPLEKELMVGSERFILKKKSSKFNERKPKERRVQTIPDNIPDLSDYINENRVRSAISKYPEDVKPGVIVAETVNDAITDYIKEFGPLESNVLNSVKKSISRLVYPIYIKIKK